MVRRALSVSLVVLVTVGMSACSRSAGQPPASQTVRQLDIAAVKSVVSSYFHSALTSGDWQQVSNDSTGQIQIQAGWLAGQNIAPSLYSQGDLVVHRLAVRSITGSNAVVDFDATLTNGDRRVSYTGPVSVLKTGRGWKVADYTRNGRSVAASIFTSIAGVAHASHVTVKVVGVQLEAGHVDVWVRIINNTSAHLTWDQPMVVISSIGQQLGHGSLFVSSSNTTEGFVMLPHVSVFGDFLIDNVTLPLTTRSFVLSVGATNEQTNRPIDLRVPVQISG